MLKYLGFYTHNSGYPRELHKYQLPQVTPLRYLIQLAEFWDFIMPRCNKAKMDQLPSFPHGCSCLINSSTIHDFYQFYKLLKQKYWFSQCKVKQTSILFLLYHFGNGRAVCFFIFFSHNPLVWNH